MKIAIIGSGFAGLALCYYLQKRGCSVSVFDKGGVAAGASGIASGLIHPYVGEEIKRSLLAEEAIFETKHLIQIAQKYSSNPLSDFSGIERIAQNESQKAAMMEHTRNFSDITHIEGNRFLIKSGGAVQTTPYLQSLFSVCEEGGVTLHKKEVGRLDELEGFDAIIVAAGVGIFGFKEFSAFRLDTTRGQSLLCSWPPSLPPLPRSLIGKGYIAKGVEGMFSAGATYERGNRSLEPDLESAIKALSPKMETLYPGLVLDPIEVKAGIRVTSKGHYFPLIGKVKDNLWVMTGLGSRGLLYHALFAKMLAEAIVTGVDSHIPEITKILLSKSRALSYNP
ncbi:MAG: FAD-dependent oxidoreductase [Chlamydiae bacterium]|nr:FAD-dependent oxidoreductase [Chlamydiota bacterium]